MFTVKLPSGTKLQVRFEVVKLDSPKMSHVTNCFVKIAGGRFRYRASAFCCRSDEFCQETGEDLSLRRALNAMEYLCFSEDDKQRILDAYHRSKQQIIKHVAGYIVLVPVIGYLDSKTRLPGGV